jgi:hypothetical protein
MRDLAPRDRLAVVGDPVDERMTRAAEAFGIERAVLWVLRSHRT